MSNSNGLTNTPRTGIILAAGFGSRLAAGDGAAAMPKPLTPVAGTPLILRALDSIALAGCRRAVIVLGYQPDRTRAAVEAHYRGPLEVHYALNERFDLQNGRSVLAARPLVKGPFVLMMVDHVVGDGLMERAARHTPPAGGATLLVDHKLDAIFDIEDATKVREHGSRVQAIGKDLSAYNCVDTGIFVCTQGLMEALQAVVDEQGDASLSDGVRRLAARGTMHTLDIDAAFWQDVDTPEMLAHAEAHLRNGSLVRE